MKKAILCVIVLSLLFMSSCVKKDEGPEPVDLGLEYFPVTIGHYVDYLVDSSYVDEQFGSGTGVQVQYELRELIAGQFVDQAGRTMFRLERFVKDTLNEWVIRDVWAVHRSEARLERFEENQRKIRLVFPPNTQVTWDLNALNTDEEVEMEYEAVDMPFVAGGIPMDSTLIVDTTYPNNLVETKEDREVFAKGIGMVGKHWVRINSQYNQTSGQWEDTGFDVRYTYMGHGQL